jgi:hypothetical protein
MGHLGSEARAGRLRDGRDDIFHETYNFLCSIGIVFHMFSNSWGSALLCLFSYVLYGRARLTQV